DRTLLIGIPRSGETRRRTHTPHHLIDIPSVNVLVWPGPDGSITFSNLGPRHMHASKLQRLCALLMVKLSGLFHPLPFLPPFSAARHHTAERGDSTGLVEKRNRRAGGGAISWRMLWKQRIGLVPEPEQQGRGQRHSTRTHVCLST
ncbi:hypothetical protein KUCAC02_014704, partial [Chaenocephalus aceratus]